MLKKINGLLFTVLMFAPVLSFATNNTARGFIGLITDVEAVISKLIPFAISLALLLFLFGVLRYMVGKDGGDKSEAKKFMIWGIVMLFVMTSVWGIVNILSETIFGSGGANHPTPSTPIPPSVDVRPSNPSPSN